MTTKIKQRIEQTRRGEVPEGYCMKRAMLYPMGWGEPTPLNTVLHENTDRNEKLEYGKEDVLSVSGELGIINQIELLGRSYAGESVAPYHVVETGDVVYTKSPLKDNPYGIIKQNRGKPGIVSTLYAVYHCDNLITGQYLENYFSIDSFLNNYLRPIVKRGAKNDMKVNNEDVLLGTIPLPQIDEQKIINEIISHADHLIRLKQMLIDELKKLKRACLAKMFPQEGETVPEIRFPGFTAPWEKRMLRDEFARRSERNDGSFKKQHWISVAKMYYQSADKVQSNNIDTRTYIMRKGDIAFEGHPNADFKYGRFVVNDIGDGIISELFPIYRHLGEFDIAYWKVAIQKEDIMAPIIAKAITTSGASSNKLNEEHFLRQFIFVPSMPEQVVIGKFFSCLDSMISLYQNQLKQEVQKKKAIMQLLLTGIVRVNQ